VPGGGFSIEPGVYLPERFGMRSEINVLHRHGRSRGKSLEPQDELILV